jgi:hypothetical protein
MASKQVINVISVAGGILAGLAVFLWLSGSGPYNLPSSVVRHEAAPNDGGLESFTLKIGPGSGMFALSSDMVSIAKHEVAEKRPVGAILFIVVGDGEDQFGKAVQVDVFDLGYQMDDLNRVRWSNFDGPRFLDMGRIVHEYRAGEKFIADYCADNPESSEAFCAAGVKQ